MIKEWESNFSMGQKNVPQVFPYTYTVYQLKFIINLAKLVDHYKLPN